MANLIILNAHGRRIAIEAMGEGTDTDPYTFNFGGSAGAPGTVEVSEIAAGDNNIGNVDIASIAAGETHIGNLSSSGVAVIVTPTVSTTPAYTAGDAIGGKITIANAVRVSGGVSILQSIHILDRANQKPAGTILIFNADPSAATITDNSAFVFSTDDLKVVASIPVAAFDYVTINSKAVATLRNIGAEVKVASGTTLYAAFVAANTPTFVATSDLQLIFGLLHVN